MEKYKNKYRIPSARLEGYDYGSEGAYFITICTAKRKHYFGEIIDNSLIFSDMGELAEQFWWAIPQYFPWVELGSFVVMPNHIHGILFIRHVEDSGKGGDAMNRDFAQGGDVMNRDFAQGGDAMNRDFAQGGDAMNRDFAQGGDAMNRDFAQGGDAMNRVSTTIRGGFSGDKNPMLQKNIASVIRWYKGRVSFEIRKKHAGFAWQSRFHDHIIRNIRSFERIQDYIERNPSNWCKDTFYTETT